MADNQLGTLLRLWGLSTSQLPPRQATADDITPFLLALLQEAVAFIDTVDECSKSSPWTILGRKVYRGREAGSGSSSSSEGKKEPVFVELLERIVSSNALKAVLAANPADPANIANTANTAGRARKPVAETWVCRRSHHANAAEPGTASWAEFRTHLKDDHAASEMAMTPTVVAAREALVWPAATAAFQGGGTEEGGRRWSHFTLALHEMQHKIGWPLDDRVFPVLQMTCAAVSGGSDDGTGDDNGGNDALLIPEFLVVSVSVNDFATADVPGHGAVGAAPAPAVAARLRSKQNVVVGAYVSVERVRLLPTGASDDRGAGLVDWAMATASDARGVLLPWIQALAVPGQIAKDVPLFLRWLKQEVRGNSPQAPATAPVAVVAAAEGPAQTATPPLITTADSNP